MLPLSLHPGLVIVHNLLQRGVCGGVKNSYCTLSAVCVCVRVSIGLPEKDSAVRQTALLGRLETGVEMCSEITSHTELNFVYILQVLKAISLVISDINL